MQRMDYLIDANKKVGLDTSKLEVGKYVCVALVSTENSNYVWLNGNLVTEYYLNFEVIL